MQWLMMNSWKYYCLHRAFANMFSGICLPIIDLLVSAVGERLPQRAKLQRTNIENCNKSGWLRFLRKWVRYNDEADHLSCQSLWLLPCDLYRVTWFLTNSSLVYRPSLSSRDQADEHPHQAVRSVESVELIRHLSVAAQPPPVTADRPIPSHRHMPKQKKRGLTFQPSESTCVIVPLTWERDDFVFPCSLLPA